MFIAGGATLRQVNQLFALAALMIAPMLFNWRIAMASIHRISVRRRFPRQVSAGEHLMIDVMMTNERQRLDSYTLHVRDVITLVDPPLKDYRTVVDVAVPRIAVQETATASYRCHFYRRGLYRFGPLSFSTRFPMGLIEGTRKYRKQDEIIVAPRMGHLTPAWTQLIYGQQSGSQTTSARRGLQEGDYYAMRQWRSGDSQRWVHWRTSARTGQLMVKQFEEESEQDVALIWDVWQPETPSPSDLDRVELSASVMATASLHAAQNTTGSVTVGLAAASPFAFTNQNTAGFVPELLRRMAVLQGSSTAKVVETIKAALKMASPGCRIVMISTRPWSVSQLVRSLEEHGAEWVGDLASRLAVLDVSETETLDQFFRLN